MKCLILCLLLSTTYLAHADDCSTGTPPPTEVIEQSSLAASLRAVPLPIINPHFEGVANVMWNDDGRCMTLLNDVTYIDKEGIRWTAWKGMGTDGASIPPVVWSFVGGPYEGTYRKAALVHDAACYVRKRSWQASARMFYEAMLIAGTNRTKALLMYEAVYMFGPKWSLVRTVSSIPSSQVDSAVNQIRTQEGASPGQLLVERTPSRGSGHLGIIMEVTTHLTVKISPPNPIKFTASDFEVLARRIQKEEEDNPGTVTLEEIQSYKPEGFPQPNN